MNYTLTVYFLGKYRKVEGRLYENAAGNFVFSSDDGWIQEKPIDQIKDSLNWFDILKLRALGWRP